MSIRRYWLERLTAKTPFFDDMFLLDTNYCVLKAGSEWPQEFSRMASYKDYLQWREAKRYPKEGTFDNRLYQIKLSGLVYVNGRQWHLHRRRVCKKAYFDGSIFVEKDFTDFIRLDNWEKHVDYFQQVTGLTV